MSTDERAERTQQPEPEETEHRHRPHSPAFKAFIATAWSERPAGAPALLPAAAHTRARRAAVSAAYPGVRLVVPAGGLRVRSNDTDYRYRPHSAFAHLTGLGADREPDAALVLEPMTGADGEPAHEARLYVRPSSPRTTDEFYANARYGELWVGPRPTLADVAAETGLMTRHLDDLIGDLTVRAAGDRDEGPAGELGAGPGGGFVVRIVPGADPALDAELARARALAGLDADSAAKADEEFARMLSELRLVKDDFEIEQMRLAVEVSVRGFEDIVRVLPRAMAHPRGERVVERAFEGRAREEGNGVGYETIAAAGAHACTLHWIRNDGPVGHGELILVDAGAEVETLYTADITRTIPVSGRFSAAQREVYEAVLAAADAAFAMVRPGVLFREVHGAAMGVIAERIHGWGLLPGTIEESLADEGQFHRRWMVHGTSHHLGLDVHDCAQARKSMYLDAELRPGMIFTIEPGLYFFPDDLLAPEAFRGIGVRIEDNVLVTQDGYENLTAGLPRTVAGIESWMASLRA